MVASDTGDDRSGPVPARSPDPGRVSTPARWRGVLVTIVVLGAIEAVRRAGVEIPDPDAVYLSAVVYATFTGGVVPGAVSGLLALLYGAGYFSVPGRFLEYTPAEWRREIIWCAAITASVVMVGFLRRGRERDAVALGEAAVREGEQRARADAADALVRSQRTLEATQAALRENVAQLRLVRDQLPAVVWTTDGALRFTSSQGSGLASLGLRPGEAVGKTLYEFFGTTDEAFSPIVAHRRALAGVTVCYELEWQGQSYQNIVEPFRDANGIVVGTIGVAFAITERKAAEAALRKSEGRYRLLFESSPVPMWVYDRETLHVLEVNGAAVAEYGYSRDEFLAMTIGDYRPAEDLPRVLEQVDRLGAESSHSGRWRHRRKDGTLIDVEVTSHGLEFGGRPARTVLAVDVTERVKAEAALREAEQRYRTLFEQSADGIMVVDPVGGRILEVNAAAARMLAYRPEEMVGLAIPDIEGAETPEETREHLRRMQETGFDEFETRMRGKDGRVHEVAVVVKATSVAGRPLLHSVLRDVTEQRRAQERLAASEARLRTIIETEPECVKLVSREGDLLEMNAAGLAMIEADSIDQVAGTPVEGLLAPSSRGAFSALLARVFTGVPADLEFEIVGLKGTRRWMESRAAPLRDGAGVVTAALMITRDATQRKLAEDALRERERTYKTLLSNLSGMAFRCHVGADWVVEFVSEGCMDLTGYRPEDLTVHRTVSLVDLMHPDDRDVVRARCRANLASRLPCSNEYRIVTRLGQEKWVWDQARGVYSDSGELVAVEGFITDISVQKSAEQAVGDAEARYRSLVENSPLGIMVHQDRKCVYANRAVLRILGAGSAGDLVGRDIESLVHPDDRVNVRERLAAIDASEPAPLLEEKLLRLDGGVVDVEVVAGGTVFAGRPAVQVIVNDISERRRLQRDLMQAQKMEAVGQLAAGITHDFNNLLTAIFAYIGMARGSLRADDPATAALDGVALAATQAAGVTRSLLTFSRRAAPEMAAVDLRAVVRECVELLRPSLPASINVVKPAVDETGRGIWVHADSVQLKQAVVNLGLNARDAMTEGGVLTVGLALGSDGSEARVTVADSGVGIRDEDRSRLFEPFFTTKGSEGTGLGLAIVGAIVKSHRGRVEVESQHGRGSVFTIVLPTLADGPAPLAGEAVDRAGGRGVLVAVAGENRQVRAVIATALRRTGHAVLEAADPAGLGDLLDRHMADLRLLVIDAAGPESPVYSIAVAARARVPDLPLLLLTSSGETPAVFADPGLYVVVKPFSVEQLTSLVARIVGRPPADAPASAVEGQR